MVHNCNYDKVNLLASIRAIAWRLEQYKKDAKDASHPLCEKMYVELGADLEKYSQKLEAAITGLAKEGKFTFCKKC